MTDKKQKDFSMKAIEATYKTGENVANAAMKGADNLAKGFTTGFSKGLHKKR